MKLANLQFIEVAGTEGYRICTEFCAGRASYPDSDPVEQVKNGFTPNQSINYARAQFSRRIQSSDEPCLAYLTALKAIARKCNYPVDIFDEC